MAALALLPACGPAPITAPPPPIPIDVEHTTLQADGLDHTRITARPRAPEGPDDRGGLVVSFSATGGLLSSSAAPIDEDGTATVILVADREAALLGRERKPITVRATVARALQDVETGTASLTFVAPTAGAPSLTLSAEPPVALANGADTVALTLNARRLAAGTEVALSADGGALDVQRVTLDATDGDTVSASFVLTAPMVAQEVLVTATEPGGAFDTIRVSFVDDGAAQFDLTGVFAQASPARIRMRSASLNPDPQCIVAPSFIKVTLVQEGDVVHADYETCFVTLATVTSIVGEVTSSAPPAFFTSIPHVLADIPLPGVSLGAVFDPPRSIVVSGAALSDPADEALPTDDEDERVRDSDGDGRPGVTVLNSIAGEQNITFRNRGDTHGHVASSNRVVGDVPGSLTALPESSVLGFGNSFIPEFEALPSVFEMLRVDGQNESPDMDTNGDGDVSCQEIVDAQDFLFSIEPPATPLDCEGIE